MRNGFISNSSSSSFVIAKSLLSAELIKSLLEYTVSLDNYDGWDITESENYIEGWTIMNNDSIRELFDRIGIHGNMVRFTED